MTRRLLLPVVVLGALLAVLLVVVTGSRGPSAPAVDVPVAADPPPTADGRIDPRWLSDTSRPTEIPARVLEAYAQAAVRLERDDPTCALAWNTLAGIGRIESVHGAFGGAAVAADGAVSPRIIGIALDGTQGTQAIADSDGGRLDGDATWDRAVGPMQFIPSTWGRWGADGDADGTADPHDVDDAALAAGRYLCHAGADLSASRGWSDAVLTYNRSVRYARDVARTATGYARDLEG